MSDKSINPIFGIYRRTADIIFRTAHIISTSILFGGHFFEAPKEQLLPFLIAAILTGAALILSSCHFDRYWASRTSGVAVIFKLLLLSSALVLWEHRVLIFIGVMLIGAVVSHAPSWFRNSMIISVKEKIAHKF